VATIRPLLQTRVGRHTVLERTSLEERIVLLQFPDNRHLDAILQVCADTREVFDDANVVLGEVGRRTNT
jgi:hypothetical protein